MKPDEDWARWLDTWQKQPTAVDVHALQRQVQRKLWHMRVVVALRWAAAVVSIALLAWLGSAQGIPARGKEWVVVMLIVLAVAMYLRSRTYRGTWREASESIPGLLELSARRARSGVQLARVNIVVTAVVIVVVLAFVASWKPPSEWLHELARPDALVAVVLIVPATALSFVFNTLYLRRQRRQLRAIEALLKSESVVDADPGDSGD